MVALLMGGLEESSYRLKGDSDFKQQNSEQNLRKPGVKTLGITQYPCPH
jgi:hypothetical protein